MAPHDSLLERIRTASRAWDGFRWLALDEVWQDIEEMRTLAKAPCLDLPADRADSDRQIAALASAQPPLVEVHEGQVRAIEQVEEVRQPAQGTLFAA